MTKPPCHLQITDVDDKIIIRARRRRLLDLEKKKTDHTEASLSELWKAAFDAYAKSNLPQLLQADGPPLTPENYKQRRDAAYGHILSGEGTLAGEGKPSDAEAKIKMHVSNTNAAVDALAAKQILDGAEEILLPYLDSLYKETIDTSDQTIFTDLTKYMEGEFFDDMDALNVLRPNVLTRVTEYVPQIVSFVKQIVDKGFAYESEGSVYFDIAAFEKAGNPYARLRPDSRNDKSLQEEGEGSLGKSLGGKKGSSDFALWKKSKKGEPFWDSPWGNGRPGWHIECSVMASDVLGEHIDIHSGGKQPKYNLALSVLITPGNQEVSSVRDKKLTDTDLFFQALILPFPITTMVSLLHHTSCDHLMLKDTQSWHRARHTTANMDMSIPGSTISCTWAIFPSRGPKCRSH